ncbi:MAG: IS110 family transposase [Actinomycetota bacterium]|nr:IS110 family transposase [Actinomycetota bacterium]
MEIVSAACPRRSALNLASRPAKAPHPERASQQARHGGSVAAEHGCSNTSRPVGVTVSKAARPSDGSGAGRINLATCNAATRRLTVDTSSSGDHRRHRLSRAGNRRINRSLHIMAIVQLRNDTKGRAYYRRKLADGKHSRGPPLPETTPVRTVYKQLVTDAHGIDSTSTEAGPKGHLGATLTSSAAGPTPTVDSSDQHFPDPPHQTLRLPAAPS